MFRLGLDLAISLLLVLLLKTYVVSAFQVEGGSMCSTLNATNEICHQGRGEYVIVDKLSYQFKQPQRGDIVIFRPPGHSEEFFVKRVIGLPGETLEIKKGKIYLNGTELDEAYLNSENRNRTYLAPGQQGGKNLFKIPPDSYFVMGDNRGHSTDSRSCFEPLYYSDQCDDPDYSGHYVEAGRIEGRAWIILWPLEKAKVL